MAQQAISSPCVNLCRMDAASGLCTGCQRNINEIVAWATLSEAQRLHVMHEVLPARRQALAEAPAGRRP